MKNKSFPFKEQKRHIKLGNDLKEVEGRNGKKNVLCLYSKHKLPFKVRIKKTECIFVVNKTVKIKIYVNNVKFRSDSREK